MVLLFFYDHYEIEIADGGHLFELFKYTFAQIALNQAKNNNRTVYYVPSISPSQKMMIEKVGDELERLDGIESIFVEVDSK